MCPLQPESDCHAYTAKETTQGGSFKPCWVLIVNSHTALPLVLALLIFKIHISPETNKKIRLRVYGSSVSVEDLRTRRLFFGQDNPLFP